MLCEFAHHFPSRVERFLARGAKLRRRFREESVTDLMMESLVVLGGGSLIVEFPDEPVTGADMQWDFVNPDDGTFFRVLLQAKQAYGKRLDWKRHSYRHLFHSVAGSGKLQLETLCDAARNATEPTHPMHILYNPLLTCTLARQSGVAGIAGITLVDSYLVERLVKAASTQKLKNAVRKVGILYPYFTYLSDIFCPQSVRPIGIMAFRPSDPGMLLYLNPRTRSLGFPVPPTPMEVRDRFVAIRDIFASQLPANLLLDIPAIPPVAEFIPADVRARIERRGEDIESKNLDRWRITFVSQNRRDDRATG